MENNENTNSTLQDNNTNSLNKLLIEVLGADFDAEKTKALESKLTTFIGKTTVPRAVFSDSNSKLKELKTKLAERAEKNKGSEEWEKKVKALTDDYEQKLKIERDKFNSYLLDSALKEAKARNPKTVKALLDLDKLTYTDSGIDGLEEQLKELKGGSDSYLFDIPANSVQKGTGNFPASSEQKTEQSKPTKIVI